jgi:hypothetical protein
LFENFGSFLTALAEHWVALMGGFIMLSVSLYERFRKEAPTRVWLY